MAGRSGVDPVPSQYSENQRRLPIAVRAVAPPGPQRRERADEGAVGDGSDPAGGHETPREAADEHPRGAAPGATIAVLERA